MRASASWTPSWGAPSTREDTRQTRYIDTLDIKMGDRG